MSIDPAPFVQIFADHLPARGSRAHLALAPRDGAAVWCDGDALFAAVQLIVFDADDPTMLLDIKEQEVCVGRVDPNDVPRWRACIEANVRAMPALLDRYGDEVDTVMPMDVVGFPEALADASLRTVEDFARAFADAACVEAWYRTREENELEEQLADAGLGGHGATVRALARRSIRLITIEEEDIAEDDVGVGGSRIGGAPDLPASMAWPSHGDDPLVFVAQLDLAELTHLDAASELPSEGLLSFFYSPQATERDGTVPVRVLYVEPTSTLERREPPVRVDRVPACSVDLAPETVYPPMESPFYEALLPVETQRSFRTSLVRVGRGGAGPVIDPLEGLSMAVACWGNADPERPTHRVLGYASSIQGDPYVDVEAHVVRGGYEGWNDASDEALGIRSSARRWRLLLQIDAEGDGDLLLNQDGGFFYFWITDDDLRARNWSAVRGTLQCH